MCQSPKQEGLYRGVGEKGSSPKGAYLVESLALVHSCAHRGRLCLCLLHLWLLNNSGGACLSGIPV